VCVSGVFPKLGISPSTFISILYILYLYYIHHNMYIAIQYVIYLFNLSLLNLYQKRGAGFIRNLLSFQKKTFFNLAFFSLENNSRVVICCCRYTRLSLFTGKVFYKQITRRRRVFSKKRKRNSSMCNGVDNSI